MKKMPPIQKILEAYTAIVDKHVELKNNEALVTSSNGAKTYTVSCEDNIYHSNDNATYWQGFDQKLADNFASVNWNEVNAKFKRNYAKAASEVIKEKGLDEKEVMAELEKVYGALKDLPITIKRGALRPPKASK